MPITRELRMPESTILEAQDELFYELISTGSVWINRHETTIFELLENVMDEDKDNIINMLLVAGEAKETAVEVLWSAFKSEFDEEEIEKHLIYDGEAV